MKKHLLTAVSFFLVFMSQAQWIDQNANFINDTLGFYEISIPAKKTAWAVCYDGKAGLLSPRPVLSFTRTLNGGETWQPGRMGTDSTLRFSNISAIDGREAWVAMHKIGPVYGSYYGSFSKGGGVYHTVNGGSNWVHVKPGQLFNNNSIPRFVHFKNSKDGIAVGDPNGGYWEIYRTRNQGKNWKRVSQSKIPAPLGNEVGWISGFAAIGNTIWFGTDSGRIYKSRDFGKTWNVTRIDNQFGAYVHEIAFLDDGLTGVAHLRNATSTFVFSTLDGGVTWTNYFQPANWKNSRVTAVPGTRAFVSTSVHGNPLYRGSAVSYDAGATWTEIDNLANKAACRFYDANTGYAGGFFVTGPPLRGGIFKSAIVFQAVACSRDNAKELGDVSRTEIAQQSLESSQLLNAYPTPAGDVINISLGKPLSSTSAVISLISLDGKVVLTRRCNPSTIVQLNVRDHPQGLYVVRVESAGKTINKTITISR